MYTAFTVEQLRDFLVQVDHTFPIPLSQKQDLSDYARKLWEKATLCYELRGDRIISLVAGYTENVQNNIGYIAVVATLPEARGQHLASLLVQRFIRICREHRLSAVHLYTTPDNHAAKRLYRRLGFVNWELPDEPRPQDTHLILELE